MLSATPLVELALLAAEPGELDASSSSAGGESLLWEEMAESESGTSDWLSTESSEAHMLESAQTDRSTAEPRARLEVAFVDATVDDFQQLVDDLLENADPERDLEVYLLDSSRDGVEQIASILAGYEDVEALHLISHASEGRIKLGSTWLHSGNLDAHAGDIAKWGGALSDGADMLLYGCDLASGDGGGALVDALAAISGCDVAASVDLTGHASLGGDWVLEYTVGVLETDIAISSQLQHSWIATLPNTAPTITSDATPSLNENTSAVHTLTATDSEGDTVSFTISGGVDQAFFTVDGSNNLAFIAAPDFEAPGDADADNIYLVEVTANDGNGGTAVQSIQVTVLPVNEHRPVFSTAQNIYVDEHETFVYTVVATDADDPAPSITYSITGGNDAGQFTIDANTGDVTFNVAPSYETPGDQNADNLYNIDITADDGNGFTEVQQVTVHVTDIVETPSFTSSSTANVAENQTAVLTVTATHPDLPPGDISYAITGGVDAALFSLDGTTGELTFAAAPDYEAPDDSGGDNVYDLEVTATATDGSSTAQALQVTVTPVNDNNPVFTSSDAVNMAEGSGTTVLVVAATDADQPAQAVTYSIVGGADAAHFSINGSDKLKTKSQLDYEAPADADLDNVYEIDLMADDGNGGTTLQTVRVTVTPVNDNSPVFTSSATASVAENTTSVQTVTATDADLPAQSITYSISGGADSALFTINTTTGDLSFAAAPDYEAPADSDANNVYEVDVLADDGNGRTTIQSLQITVSPVNDNTLAFTSSATATIDENMTLVQTVAATDADLPAQSITYSISGGADAALFTIDAATGDLSFAAAPDYEAPADSDTDNVYQVDVLADEGNGETATQSLQVTVAPVNDNAPIFSSSATAAVDENTTFVQTVTATDADLPAQSVTYSISGGLDSALFTINTTTGDLSFAAALDYEAPADSDANNVYEVDVLADDGNGRTTVQSLQVTVRPVDDNPLAFTSSATATIDENTAFVQRIAATDADLPAQSITYSISGGADAALFTIDAATGDVSFAAAPDYEAPGDADRDSVYEVDVLADNGSGGTVVQSLQVTVAGVNDNSPLFTSSNTVNIDENTTFVQTVTATDADEPAQSITYSISGGADAALFTIDAATGDLGFVAAPDYEAPADADADNVYAVHLMADDGNGRATVQSLQVSVTPVSDSTPVFTSSTAATVDENTTFVQTVTATDADLPAQSFTYSIRGGADAALFTIDPSTGELAFAAPRDYEAPDDADGDNVYEVTVQVDDGSGGVAQQAIGVEVTGTNEFPEITSPTAVTVAENTSLVMTVTSTDVDGGTPTYSIRGGDDARRFAIDAVTGQLQWAGDADFERPTDVNTDNVYEVLVEVADGRGGSDVETILVTVTDANDAPVAAGNSYGVEAGKQLIIAPRGVLGNDYDADGDALTAALAGGPLHGSVTLNADGSFQYVPTANYSGTDTFSYSVSDGNGGTATAVVTVTVSAPVAGPIAPPPAEPSQSPRSSEPSESTDSSESSESTDSSSSSSESSSNAEESAPSAGEVAGVAPPAAAQVAPGGMAGATAAMNIETTATTTMANSVLGETIPGSEASAASFAAADRSESATARAERQMARSHVYVSGGLMSLSYDADLLWDDLADLQKDLQSQDDMTFLAAGSAAGVTSSFTVGYVLWTIRSGWLVTSLLAHMPAWSMVDPLAVLEYLDGDGEESGQNEDDSLESLLQSQSDEPASDQNGLPGPDDLSVRTGGVGE